MLAKLFPCTAVFSSFSFLFVLLLIPLVQLMSLPHTKWFFSSNTHTHTHTHTKTHTHTCTCGQCWSTSKQKDNKRRQSQQRNKVYYQNRYQTSYFDKTYRTDKKNRNNKQYSSTSMHLQKHDFISYRQSNRVQQFRYVRAVLFQCCAAWQIMAEVFEITEECFEQNPTISVSLF